MRKLIAMAAFGALSACGGSIVPASSVTSAPPPAPTSGNAFRNPQVMNARGLESVIGARAGALTGRFGTARIDLTEGDARKLQFLGSECVLDIYLYPMRKGEEPIATHVETRLRQGGSATDRARCIDEVAAQARSRG